MYGILFLGENMKYLILSLIVFTGCNQANKHSEFTCITALGTLTVSSEQAGLKVDSNFIVIETPDNTIRVSRHTCVEVGAK